MLGIDNDQSDVENIYLAALYNQFPTDLLTNLEQSDAREAGKPISLNDIFFFTEMMVIAII